MEDERRRVLQMLQDGVITADQAMELLSAFDDDDAASATAVADMETADEMIAAEPPPDMGRYRRFWKYPFFACLAFLLIFGLWLRSIYQSSEGAITFGFICVWSFFMLAFVATLLALLSRQATWLHVRVKEKEGRRIAISLPLPLGLASWGIKMAHGFVDKETRTKLEMADQFLAAAKAEMRQPDAQPMFIDVDDDDGDQVQVYIG